MHRPFLRKTGVTAIRLGRPLLERLDATYPPAPRTTSTLAYLVLLRAEIARFTRSGLRLLQLLFGSGLRPSSRLRTNPPLSRAPHRPPKGLACLDSSLLL